MKIESLTVGLKVKHAEYGIGTVKSVSEHTAEIRFDDAMRTVDPALSGITLAEPAISISSLEIPLQPFVQSIVESVIERMGYEKPEAVVAQLASRWHKGKAVLHPADPA